MAELDLRAEVTVFVTTVGAPTFVACLEHLRRQDSTFALEIIERVAPISAASQRMIDRCRTPFYVQVDEDMLLRPAAVRSLHQHIRAAPATVAEVVGYLFDVHLERPIEGVKIFRHAVLRRYPFTDEDGCDVRQLQRLEADGFAVVRLGHALRAQLTAASPEIMGLHGTGYDARSAYERYLTWWLKYRRGTIPRQPPRADAHRFLDRLLDDPSELNLCALMGIVAAHLVDREAPLGEKDFRTYGDLPGYRALARFRQDCRQGFGARGRAPDDAPPA